MTTFATRLTAALGRVPADMRGRVRARVRARPHELSELERVLDRRYGAGVAAAAARPAKRRAKPRALKAELDAAVGDGRITASRRAHYERLAARDGEAKVAKLLRSLAPGIDPATSAALALPAEAPRSDGPWMTPQRRGAPGQVLNAGRAPELAAAEPPARPRRPARIDWSLDGADVEASSGPDINGPDLHAPPFASSHPAPNVPPLGMPRSNGHGRLPPGRSAPGQVIDGGPRG